MKKKLFIGALILLPLLCCIFILQSYTKGSSHLEDTKFRMEQKKLAEYKVKRLLDNSGYGKQSTTKPRGFCHKFTITVNYVLGEVETDVIVCCTTYTMNCHPIPGHIFGKTTNKTETESDPSQITVTKSSTYTDEEGYTYKIKEGVYDVIDGQVQFDIIEILL